MNTTFPDTEIGRLITVKLDEYEKANDPEALQLQALFLKIFNVALFVFGVAFIGFVGGCIASAIIFSSAPILVYSLGILVAAGAILAVFYRVMNIREIYSYDLLKRVKGNWGSSSVDLDLRLLIIDAEGYLKKFKHLNEQSSVFNKWTDTLALDLESNSYKVAQFLGIPFDEMHQNLLSLNSKREREVVPV